MVVLGRCQPPSAENLVRGPRCQFYGSAKIAVRSLKRTLRGLVDSAAESAIQAQVREAVSVENTRQSFLLTAMRKNAVTAKATLNILDTAAEESSSDLNLLKNFLSTSALVPVIRIS